jgi:hypothetical protein
LQPFTAINGDHFAVDVTGLLGQEEAREIGQLLMATGAA